MANLTNLNNNNPKQQNFDQTQKMTPNSNYFAGRFVNRSRNANRRMR